MSILLARYPYTLRRTRISINGKINARAARVETEKFERRMRVFDHHILDFQACVAELFQQEAPFLEHIKAKAK